MGDRGKPGGAEVLLASQVWPAALVPAGVLGLLVGTSVWLLRGVPLFPVGFLLGVVVLAWFQRGDALLADETGLLLRHRGRVTRPYRWHEIHQAGLARPWFAQAALAIYPHGGPWDVPGPNSAVLVGRIWMLGRPNRETRERVYAILRSRGVAIDEKPVGRFGRLG
ncbi:hypothetical protein ACIBOV_32390 [Micromonospora chersina]|uniref:hypothetical protein n=1 Tax=Micromonospora chersina TaxID=47854 RepID=UPI0037A4D77F